MKPAKVALVGPISVAWENPARMLYGGVERVGWRLTHLLSAVGHEALPIGPSDSSFDPSISRRALWPHPSLLKPGRAPVVFAEDAVAITAEFARHVTEVMAAERPDVIILLGPSAQLLKRIELDFPRADERLIVALHNGPVDNSDTIPILDRLSHARIVALSDAQRRAFGKLAGRIEVVLDGIPVEAVPYSSRPRDVRNRIVARNDALAMSISDPSRPIISQVDYFHPNKGMLLSLDLYRASGLFVTHDLILAGGMGWQLPASESLSTPSVGTRYLWAMRDYIELHSLQNSVRILGPLTGALTINLLRASEVALSPTRMAHGALWPDDDKYQGPEAYGQGRALANAVGTPVLMSDRYDSSFTPQDLPYLRFSDSQSGVKGLSRAASDCVDEASRKRFRRFSLERDSVAPGFIRYLEIIGEVRERVEGVGSRLPSTLEASNAVQKLITAEAMLLSGNA